jgi:tripartite-type tricarboxylate transporter receptor subunit TctC
MHVMISAKRFVDYNVKVRVKNDGTGVDIANVKMSDGRISYKRYLFSGGAVSAQDPRPSGRAIMHRTLASSLVRPRRALSLAVITAVVSLALGWPAQPANASEGFDFSKPIRLIVPLTPGGSADALARIVAEEMRSVIPGATVVVENRPGALGVIGTSTVAKAPPDGHTLLLSVAATFSANPALVKNLTYDPIKDFTHVVRMATSGYVLVAGPASSATTAQGLVHEGRTNTRKLNFGYGTTTILVASTTFARMGKFDALGVSYQAQPPALTDLLGGQTHFMFADIGLLTPYIKAGKVKPLAVSSIRRATALPDVPTLDEQGFKGFDLGTWVGISAPAGTPLEFVAQINAAVNKIIMRPDIRARVEALGFDVAPISSTDFTTYVKSQMNIWTRAIRESGVERQ